VKEKKKKLMLVGLEFFHCFALSVASFSLSPSPARALFLWIV